MKRLFRLLIILCVLSPALGVAETLSEVVAVPAQAEVLDHKAVEAIEQDYENDHESNGHEGMDKYNNPANDPNLMGLEDEGQIHQDLGHTRSVPMNFDQGLEYSGATTRYPSSDQE